LKIYNIFKKLQKTLDIDPRARFTIKMSDNMLNQKYKFKEKKK